ncbi:MAG: stage II sporulation protein M [Candidatus Paceibacterota bacterium]
MTIEIIKESKTYLYHIRKYVWFSLALFIFSSLSGYYIAQNHPDKIADYLAEIEAFFESMAEPTAWETFMAIFQNNVEAMLLVVGMGIFAGFFSLTFLLVNGFMVGIFAHLFVSQGLGLIFLFGVIPHGVIEIPCLLFSAAIGFRIGETAIGKIFQRKQSLILETSEGIKFAITAIIPLLFIAALIEAYITPLFITLAQFFIAA